MSETGSEALRLERLPRWAQREIERLQQELAHAEARLAAGPDDSDTFAGPYDDTPRPLGKRAVIQFGRERQNGFTVSLTRPGVLDINAGQCIAVYPRGGNSVEIKIVER